MAGTILGIILLLGTFSIEVINVSASPSEYGSSPSAEHIYDETDILSQWYRYLDTPGHYEAELYITNIFEGYGLNTTVQEYTVQREDGDCRGANILGFLEGKCTKRCLVIGGHYDAHEYATHGAYDNAVGVATVMELIRLFTEVENGTPPISIIFAAWDAEEGGGAGSRHFLENPVWQCEIVAYINLDMFSLNYPVKNNIPMSTEEYYKMNLYTAPVKDFSRYADIEYNESTLANFTRFRDTLENITYEKYEYPKDWVLVMDDTVGASDHRFFIEKGIPGVWFRGMNEKPREERDLNELAFKHTPIDRLETMEEYAGGKAELLKGMETALLIAYSLANEILELHNVSHSHSAHETEEDDLQNAGQFAFVIVIILLVAGVAYVVWKRHK